jgi:hypothetical protein
MPDNGAALTEKALTVEQCDRDTAAEIAETLEIEWAAGAGYFAAHLRQILARHRTEARRAALEEAEQVARNEAEQERGMADEGFELSVGAFRAAENIAQAIATLRNEP